MSLGTRQKAEINVTPMIDVLLVLLIIFMVIVPLASRGLPAAVPETSQTDRPEERHDLILTVRSGGTVLLNQEVVELADLQQRVEALVKISANQVVFLRGEGGLDFQQVAEVIDLIKGAGLSRIALTDQ
jgi:biopolymer transport protein ExbD